MNPKAFRFLLFVLVLGFSTWFSRPLFAQVAGGSLSGTITDPQGAAVVGAKVSAKNAATGVTTETTTNTAGAYNMVNLLPANYDVSVTATGFRTAVSKVTLTVGAQQSLSLALVVGEVAQTVEVTGAAPIVETTNATISGEVQSQQIVTLPLNGRDWASLATLEPGVAQVRPHEAVDAPGGSTRGLGAK
ncbi:MAG: carboxypeptidase-like regulatory domain-containing protein, partial [Candidatus Acidiferrales bacterium]